MMTDQEQAREYADKIAMLNRQVETGDFNYEQARVLTDNYKWLASKLDPETYGNQYRDTKSIDTQQMHLEAIRELGESDTHWTWEIMECEKCGHKPEC